MRQQLSDFLSTSKAEIISTDSVSPNLVFDRYFERKPPFSEGRKKSEFPDAFTLAALEKWCSESRDSIYVVSKDGDLASACYKNGPLFHVDSLEKLVEHFLMVESDIVDLVHERLEEHKDELEDAVIKAFEDSWILLEDQDGEATNVHVSSVSFQEFSVIELSEDSAVVEISAEISFSAILSYNDIHTAIYDSEDKTLHPWRHVEEEVQRTVVIPIKVSLQFDADDPEEFTVTNLVLNDGKLVKTWADEAAETHYK